MPQQNYHPVARYLHWAIAGLIVLQFVLAKVAENADAPLRELALLANHRSTGITIFVLAVARLAWRLRQGAPRPLPMPAWQATVSQISHWSMYVLILVLPISGWLMSSASADNVSWFDLLSLPNLVAVDPELTETLESIHSALAYLLFLIALVHTGAAVKHSVFEKNGAIRRMTSLGTLAVFGIVVIGGVFALIPAEPGSNSRSRSPGETMPAAASTAELPVWEIDYEKSYIRFTATQAGAGFAGEWPDWTAEMRFDESNLEASMFAVNVAVATVETQDEERDRTLQDAEWFDSENHPAARFQASNFRQGPDGGFAAAGVLTVKGGRTAVLLTFTVSRAQGRQVLDGQSELDRIAMQVGTGEWADTRWIGREVTVVVHVETLD